MPSKFESTFSVLRTMLQKHRAAWLVTEDSATCYSLAGKPGPASVQAWHGELRRKFMPVASVQIGKTYVSYHLMGIYGNTRLLDGVSKELKARLHGKTCFNFKNTDDALIQELDALTAQAILCFKKSGYVTEPDRP